MVVDPLSVLDCWSLIRYKAGAGAGAYRVVDVFINCGAGREIDPKGDDDIYNSSLAINIRVS